MNGPAVVVASCTTTARDASNDGTIGMRDDYDFSASTKNPHGEKLKQKPVTLRLDEDTLAYFKDLAGKKGLPYQSLISLYLRDCAQSQKDLQIEWQ